MRLAAHYHARADAVALSEGRVNLSFDRLVQTMDTTGVDFGTDVPSPANHIWDGLEKIVRAIRK